MQFSDKVIDILTKGYVFIKEYDTFSLQDKDEDFALSEYIFSNTYKFMGVGGISNFSPSHSEELLLGGMFRIVSTHIPYEGFRFLSSEIYKDDKVVFGYVLFHKFITTRLINTAKMALYKKSICPEIEKDVKFYLKLLI